ncbi:MAG TPA: rod-binding protein [Candidatus Bathyarchaeia archaeon]|nr:rod-binding protein [Candidatus Bathyarchaeia archaeon]
MDAVTGTAAQDAKATGQRSGSSTRVEPARLREAAREFEGLMIEHMLKTARQPMGKTSWFEHSGAGSSLYQDMADEQMAKAMARGGGLGLGDVLIRSLTRQGPKNFSSPPSSRPIDRGDAGGPEGSSR